jgi:hypothetical protein
MDSITPRVGLRIVDREDGTFAVVDTSEPAYEDDESLYYQAIADGFTSRAAAWRYIAEVDEARLERRQEPCTSPANDNDVAAPMSWPSPDKGPEPARDADDLA